MSNEPPKYSKSIFFLLFFYFALWAAMSLAGCGADKNIPSAGILLSGEVTLTWEKVPGAAAYSVFIATSPGVTVLNSNKISNATSPITITDLKPGTTYYFVIAVENDAGQYRLSEEKSYTASNAKGLVQFGDILIDSVPDAAPLKSESPVPEAAPGRSKPQKGQADAAETMSASKQARSAAKNADDATRDVTLAWDEVPGASSYNIYWRDRPGVTKKNGNKISGAKNPHKISGLIKGKKYYFVVTAVNASGESKQSEEFSFTVGP